MASPNFDNPDCLNPAASSHQRLKALFDAVCELPTDQQHVQLVNLQATPDEIIRVQKLLKIDTTTGDGNYNSGTNPRSTADRLSNPVAHMLESISATELKSGDKLGPWRLIEKIGEGGMGSVYRAERDDGQFSQVAAVKLLAGMPTADTLAHLARERVTLASLSHPNIARLIDGGATPRGRPYLVMDYIEGIELDRYCRDKKLPPRAIVMLLRQVCETVSYAHQRLTLHCDIKPSNVLVESSGRVVLLDFGISRMLDAARESAIEHNNANDVSPYVPSFTPRYASPEQTNGAALSTATDIFSLGRMLSQLLDGTSGDKKFAHECRAIVARATEEDPAKRYPTAQAFAVDLTRLLACEPLDAMPRKPDYIARKFLERRWGSVLVGTAFVLMAVGLTTGALIQRDRAVLAEQKARIELDRALSAEDETRTERDRAQVAEERAVEGAREAQVATVQAKNERDRAIRAEKMAQNETARALRAEAKTLLEANTTREVRDFLVGLFQDVDPGVPGSRQLTALDILDRGRNRIDKNLQDQPALQSTMFATLGRIYENIGQPQYARQLYEQAITLERDRERGRPLELAKLLSRLAILESNASNPAAGEAHARESLEIRLARLGEKSLETADAHNTLGVVLTGLAKRRESEIHLGAALAIREKEVGLASEEGSSTLHNLGQHYFKFGDLVRAETYYRRALDIKRALFAEQHPRILNSLEGLGRTLAAANRLKEAEALLAEAYRIRGEVHGAKSVHVSIAANEWASALHDLGRYPEAQRLYEESIGIAQLLQDKASGQPMSYAISINNLASLMEDMGDYAGAEEHYRTSLAIRSKHLKTGDIALARVHQNLGKLLLKRNKLDEAEQHLTTALKTREAKLNTQHQDIFDTRLQLAELALRRQQTDVAKIYLMAAKEILESVRPDRKIAYLRTDALFKDTTGDIKAAVALWELRAVERSKLSGEQHPTTLLAKLDFAEALARAGDAGRAQTLALALTAPLSTALAAQAPQLQQLASLASAIPVAKASVR